MSVPRFRPATDPQSQKRAAACPAPVHRDDHLLVPGQGWIKLLAQTNATPIARELTDAEVEALLNADKTRTAYADAARVIELYLPRFCDRSLPYSEMIAQAARKAAEYLQRLEDRPQIVQVPCGEPVL